MIGTTLDGVKRRSAPPSCSQSFDPRAGRSNLRSQDLDPRSCFTHLRSQQPDPRACSTQFRSPRLHPRSCFTQFRSPHLHPRACGTQFRSPHLHPRACSTQFRSPHPDPRGCSSAAGNGSRWHRVRRTCAQNRAAPRPVAGSGEVTLPVGPLLALCFGQTSELAQGAKLAVDDQDVADF